MRQRDHNIFASASIAADLRRARRGRRRGRRLPGDRHGRSRDEGERRRIRRAPHRARHGDAASADLVRLRVGRRSALATFYDENRHDIELADVPPIMQDAILAAEDRSSTSTRAWTCRASCGPSSPISRAPQGASTLTMQYVRQQITYTATSPAKVIAATSSRPTPARSARSAGAGARDRHVQGPDPRGLPQHRRVRPRRVRHLRGEPGVLQQGAQDLTLEAALLAALPKAPSSFDPVTEEGRPLALERRNWILGEMHELGKIDGEATPPGPQGSPVTGNRTPNGCVSTMEPWGFFATTSPGGGTSRPTSARTSSSRNGRPPLRRLRSSPR